MATVHIRNVGDSLVKELKVRAVRYGVTFRELVIRALEEMSGREVPIETRTDLSMPSVPNSIQQSEVTREAHPTNTLEERRRVAKEVIASVLEKGVDDGLMDDLAVKNDCPECGEPLVRNRLMKRWECECGWHGKKER